MPDDKPDDLTESWADILATRGPDGLAVVEKLKRAEQSVLTAQRATVAAMDEGRDAIPSFNALEAAMAEVQMLRAEIYRLARQ